MAALVVAAVLTVMGATGGLIRTVGIIALVACALAIIGTVGTVLEATGVLTRRK